MKFIIIILIIWIAIAFIYGKVKKIGFFKANIKMVLNILHCIFSNQSQSNAELRKKAQKANDTKIIREIDGQERARKTVQRQIQSAQKKVDKW